MSKYHKNRRHRLIGTSDIPASDNVVCKKRHCDEDKKAKRLTRDDLLDMCEWALVVVGV